MIENFILPVSNTDEFNGIKILMAFKSKMQKGFQNQFHRTSSKIAII